MEFSAEERLKLVEKKDEIAKITEEIMECAYNEPDPIYILNRINKITSLLSTLAGYSKVKNVDLGKFNIGTQMLVTTISPSMNKFNWASVSPLIQYWCNAVNSIVFDFTGKTPMLSLPKIDLTIFKSG